MKYLFYLFFVSASLIQAEEPVLNFYVLENSQIPDGRYIDTKEFPKLGYISQKPQLLLKKIKKASLNNPNARLLNENGTSGDRWPSSIEVVLFTEDVNNFKTFISTAAATSQPFLVSIGNKLLALQVIRINEDKLVISLRNDLDSKAIFKDFEKLIKN
jgi:hypothetical protein